MAAADFAFAVGRLALKVIELELRSLESGLDGSSYLSLFL